MALPYIIIKHSIARYYKRVLLEKNRRHCQDIEIGDYHSVSDRAGRLFFINTHLYNIFYDVFTTFAEVMRMLYICFVSAGQN